MGESNTNTKDLYFLITTSLLLDPNEHQQNVASSSGGV
jgi:hypothetical protein